MIVAVGLLPVILVCRGLGRKESEPEAGFTPDSLTMKASSLRAAQEWFESPELQSCILRFAVSSVVDINDPGSGVNVMGMAATLPTIGFNRGGTHQIAHAAHQLLVQMGCEFFTNLETREMIEEFIARESSPRK